MTLVEKQWKVEIVPEIISRISGLSDLWEFERTHGSRFGSGTSGKEARELIGMGASCEFKDPQTLEPSCDKSAIAVLDFDVGGSTEKIPICSEEHIKAVQKKVEQDLALAGKRTSFGLNGIGRS